MNESIVEELDETAKLRDSTAESSRDEEKYGAGRRLFDDPYGNNGSSGEDEDGDNGRTKNTIDVVWMVGKGSMLPVALVLD